jgi:hypothetical protein
MTTIGAGETISATLPIAASAWVTGLPIWRLRIQDSCTPVSAEIAALTSTHICESSADPHP